MKSTLCIIAKVAWSRPLPDNHLNFPMVRALTADFRRVYLIVQSADGAPRVSHHGRAVAFLLPRSRWKALDYLTFVATAVRLGLKIDRKTRVELFDASELLGGGLAGVALKRLTGRRLMAHLQGQLLHLPDHVPTASLIRAIVRFVLKRADIVRCVSLSLVEDALGSGIPQRRLAFIPTRCDTNIFDPDAISGREALRAQLGLSGRCVVMANGTFSVHKGFGYLLRAFQVVCGERPDASLILLGSGPLEGELRALAAELGIADRVIFRGRVPHDDIARHLAVADVFAVSSIDEGIPRALLEAMAMRVPSVATRVGGIPDVVKDGETGLLVEPADVAGLSAALLRLLGRRHDAAMAGRARDLVVTRFGLESGVQSYRNVVNEIADLQNLA